MAFPQYLKKDGDSIVYNGNKDFILYLPEKYFDISAAVVIGEEVEFMGICDYAEYSSGAKHAGLRNFMYPTVIRCKPRTMEKIPNFAVTKYATVDYRALVFGKGDQIITNVNIPQTVANADKFTDLMIYGNLPRTIPYNKLHEYIIMNASLNGFSYNMTAQMMGIIVSELCRDINDLTKPFRLTSMKDQLAYVMVNIKQLPKYISPYVAITSENADESIANAIINSAGPESPLEKVMMN